MQLASNQVLSSQLNKNVCLEVLANTSGNITVCTVVQGTGNVCSCSRESVESEAIKRSIGTFVSSVEEQLGEQVGPFFLDKIYVSQKHTSLATLCERRCRQNRGTPVVKTSRKHFQCWNVTMLFFVSTSLKCVFFFIIYSFWQISSYKELSALRRESNKVTIVSAMDYIHTHTHICTVL